MIAPKIYIVISCSHVVLIGTQLKENRRWDQRDEWRAEQFLLLQSSPTSVIHFIIMGTSVAERIIIHHKRVT